MKTMPHAPARLALLLLLLISTAAPPVCLAQTKEAPATVEGRITDGDEGLAGIAVVLVAFETAQRPRSVARTKTDHEGRYRLTANAPGRYQVLPSAPVYVVPGADEFPPGRTLLLGAGDTVSDIDFRLERGGVITGRVTDAEGQPVVGEPVNLTQADTTKPQRPFLTNLTQRFTTDDRGIYRMYGLPPGRYRVSAGQDTETGSVRMTPSRRFYRRTFHPDAVEEAQGRVIEVTAGSEATNVDITVGSPARTYTAAGRLVGPDGRPAAGFAVGYGLVAGDGRPLGSWGSSGPPTDSRGEFLIEGLVPGTYAVFAAPERNAGVELYSETTEFVLTDADVSGLEVKLRRGATITGSVAIEGTSDRLAVANILRRLRLTAHSESGGGSLVPPSYMNVEVGADGSFRLSGLRPGRVRLGMGWPPVPSVTLARVEVNGADLRGGIDIAEGAQVSGVRVVFTHGAAVVRGQVNILNGTLAPEQRLAVFAQRVVPGGERLRGDAGKGTQADARGRFVIEGLPGGEYEITARIFSRQGSHPKTARQLISVPEGGEVSVTLNLDLQ
jgi:hypothetical protein